MRSLVSAFTLIPLLLAILGCSSTHGVSSLKARICYLPQGEEVKIVSASTNFEAYREVFLLGFAQGYKDVMKGNLTIVEFKKSAKKNGYFYSVGQSFGARIAFRDVEKRTPLLPTPGEATPLADKDSAPVPFVADL